MKKTTLLIIALPLILLAFKKYETASDYNNSYSYGISDLQKTLEGLETLIRSSDLSKPKDVLKLRSEINFCRTKMKRVDIWLRYLEPISYKRINGPLPVEWETEVFEKFEKPYKREGAGLTLASLYLDEDTKERDSLTKLIQAALKAVKIYQQDSITRELKDYHHFFLCNRLFLLNLATIYTTGFECPQTDLVIEELQNMLMYVQDLNRNFNNAFTTTQISSNYLRKFEETIAFVKEQPKDHEKFDHYLFVKEFVNPLFAMNQEFIKLYNVKSKSYVDYSLTKEATSIFSKTLYNGQNAKGVFANISDTLVLAEIEQLGKLLFYDPILSGNNLRSCASCHIPSHSYTDTLKNAALQFDQKGFLERNTPTLLNVGYNHLLMQDGFHISLQNQARAVITSSLEMGSNENEVVKKVLSCDTYKAGFSKLLKYTKSYKEIELDHISSALTLYYTKFSRYNSVFDLAMNHKKEVDQKVKRGYNVFMSKAQCATCHFAPQFNGVKPPYVGSEFEVLGVPEDTTYKKLSKDKGRYFINPAKETENAFRTGTVRNADKTKPYMHNGVFKTMMQLVDFYDGGGGVGRGLLVPNQTLSGDSLHLTKQEKLDLIAFISSLNEDIVLERTPEQLPRSKHKKLNNRKPGGTY